MKKIAKSLMLAFALVFALSLGTGSTAEAAKVTVKKVTSVNKLTGKKTITLTKGKKATLKTTVTVTPSKAANKKVTYKTSNKKVATVSSKGVIKASKKKTGSAKITVTSKKNKKKKATVKVKVVAGKVTKVTLDKTSVALNVGATDTLKATVKTSGKKPNKTLVWTTSDAKVATVKNGVVTAVGAGTATIKVQSTDGTNKKATATVTVTGATVATTTQQPTTQNPGVTTTENPTKPTEGIKPTEDPNKPTEGTKPTEDPNKPTEDPNKPTEDPSTEDPNKPTEDPSTEDPNKPTEDPSTEDPNKPTEDPSTEDPATEKETIITPNYSAAEGKTTSVTISGIAGKAEDAANDVKKLVKLCVDNKIDISKTVTVVVNGEEVSVSIDENGELTFSNGKKLEDIFATENDIVVTATYNNNSAEKLEQIISALELGYDLVGEYDYTITVNGYTFSGMKVVENEVSEDESRIEYTVTVAGKASATYTAYVKSGKIHVIGDVSGDEIIKKLVEKKLISIEVVDVEVDTDTDAE